MSTIWTKFELSLFETIDSNEYFGAFLQIAKYYFAYSVIRIVLTFKIK
jgi:hypothetical protein